MIILVVRAIAFTVIALTLASIGAAAESGSIYNATLNEGDQKTPEVSTDQLRRILSDGSAVLLDTRSRTEFDAGHIPGAVNLNVPSGALASAVEARVKGNKGAALVLYCNGPFCQASRRLADVLATNGYSNVRRYQIGMPVWRALGGPVEIEAGGVKRIFQIDRTAVFVDARSSETFVEGSLPGALSIPVEDLASGKLKSVPLPDDDFNRRIVLFGDGIESQKLANILSKRPWHNVSYFGGSFEVLRNSLAASQ